MHYTHMKSYVSKNDGTIDYEKMYHTEDMKKSDLQPWWNNKLLKWSDSFPALCYAHGIFDIFNSDYSLSELFINNFKNVPDNSIYTARICNSGYTVRDQINFLLENKKRTPKKILEIGGGNGSVTCTLSNMGYDVQCIEPMQESISFFKETNKHFFGKTSENYRLINKSLHKSFEEIEWSGVDTVIMVESIEHILKKDFEDFYKMMVENLKGLFIITNILKFHPIQIGTGHIPEEHCRLIDDNVYDEMENNFGGNIFRLKSHLVLEKK